MTVAGTNGPSRQSSLIAIHGCPAPVVPHPPSSTPSTAGNPIRPTWPAKERHANANLALVRQHFFHRAAELRERPLGDLTAWPMRNGSPPSVPSPHLVRDAEEAIDLVGAQRLRELAVVAHELDPPWMELITCAASWFITSLRARSRETLALDVDLLAVLISDSCTGTRACRIGRSSGARASASIFRWISERTLFSCPAVVWMAYQRWSVTVIVISPPRTATG